MKSSNVEEEEDTVVLLWSAVADLFCTVPRDHIFSSVYIWNTIFNL